MIRKFLLITSLMAYQQFAFALVSCGPSSCSPSCDSSCTYYTCSGIQSHSFTTAQVPVIGDVEPADACSHSTVTVNALPINVDGINYSQLPATITHSYYVCVAQSLSGPACPPVIPPVP